MLVPSQLEVKATAEGPGQLLKQSLQPVLGSAPLQFADSVLNGTWAAGQTYPETPVLKRAGPVSRHVTIAYSS